MLSCNCLGLAVAILLTSVSNAAAQSPKPWKNAKRSLVGAWIGKPKLPEEALVRRSRDDGFESPSESAAGVAGKLTMRLELRRGGAGELTGELDGAALPDVQLQWKARSLSPSLEEFDLEMTVVSKEQDGQEKRTVKTLRFFPVSDDAFIGWEVRGDDRLPKFRFERESTEDGGP